MVLFNNYYKLFTIIIILAQASFNIYYSHYKMNEIMLNFLLIFFIIINLFLTLFIIILITQIIIKQKILKTIIIMAIANLWICFLND